MHSLRWITLLFFCPALVLADEPKPNILTQKEVEDGWLSLFDGETTFGWKADERAKVKDSTIILTGNGEAAPLRSTTALPEFELHFEYQSNDNGAELRLSGPVSGIALSTPLANTGGKVWSKVTVRSSQQKIQVSGEKSQSLFEVPAKANSLAAEFYSPAAKNSTLALRNIKLKPLGTKPIFNGKDLTGWKLFSGEKYKSVFGVTKEGWLNVKNGPGDLQTEGKYDHFVLQLECISNGPALNSGIFFRCIEGEYQNGYEMQIQNGFKENDRSKPADFGTGAIYRRLPARKVVANDKEWFGMTLLANHKQLSTWVNGIQQIDWLDPRPEDNNPRKGSKTGKGHISIQGHDVTTDLSFRNLRLGVVVP